MDDMIFVIGGFNGVTTIFHVECFDERTEEWYEATDMNSVPLRPGSVRGAGAAQRGRLRAPEPPGPHGGEAAEAAAAAGGAGGAHPIRQRPTPGGPGGGGGGGRSSDWFRYLINAIHLFPKESNQQKSVSIRTLKSGAARSNEDSKAQRRKQM
ncbi:hypothetical protein CEXT_311021 [Caerostris extrusa]|uniref:Uncharacterized protein n=1 Tax=Caerostris extrusa TaxID=172846 RepID=A0AAV4RDW2_CAEEX|nr:hypothetical protein CEXT_311021 [Caerostris extrusa]